MAARAFALHEHVSDAWVTESLGPRFDNIECMDRLLAHIPSIKSLTRGRKGSAKKT